MPNTILVTYASRSGSTAGVAKAIAETLEKAGRATVEVLPVEDVTDVTQYRAVVAGSAIQGGEWLPEAMDFVRQNQEALQKRPFAAYLVCMTLALPKEQHHQHVSSWLEPVRQVVTPISEGLFAGVLRINKIPTFRERMAFRVATISGVWSEGDHRDWDEIHAWAESLVPLLLPEGDPA